MNTTTIENKHGILADIWMNWRNEEEFEEFIRYNDLGLPIAYLVTMNIVKKTELSDNFISDTFSTLLQGLGVEDSGFESLEDVLQKASQL